MSRGGHKAKRGDPEQVAVLALLLTQEVGPVLVNRLITAARHKGHDVGALLNMTPRELAEQLPGDQARAGAAVARCGPKQYGDAMSLLERVAARGAQCFLITDAEYPQPLKHHLRETAPPLLFVQGKPELLNKSAAAVVGARTVSHRGAELAAACASAFASEEVPVVSGGAQGVDNIAHTTALADGGSTIVVLPQGLCTYRPLKTIREAVSEGRAVLLSQFSPDAPWQTHAAVTRNATVSALSRLVCVIEPKRVGGSLRAARLGLQQGKQVLLYLHDPSDVIVRSLEGAGAADLLGENGDFCPRRLLEHWRLAQKHASGQDQLF